MLTVCSQLLPLNSVTERLLTILSWGAPHSPALMASVDFMHQVLPSLVILGKCITNS